MNSFLNFPKIPEEILFDEILARLPVKSLLKFKCVSKSWRSLIESDRFIEIHYRNSAKNPRIILSNLRGAGMSRCTLQWLLKESKEGSDPTKSIELKTCIPVGCFNGVVCFYDCRNKYRDRWRFTLWNPATRVSVKLPHDSDGGGTILAKYGFGWDEKTGAHKVFVVMFDGKHFPKTGIVYNSNTNSWRSISSGSLNVSHNRGVFLRGNLHWVDRLHSEVECFDLEREEFRRLELPLLCSNDEFHPTTRRSLLGVVCGSLSILFDLEKNFEVWVMKEYGVKDSWLKFLTFPSTSLSRPAYGNWPIFGECPKGEIFIIYGETVTIYSPKYDAYSTATTNVRYLDIHVYADSLVSRRR